MYNFISKFFRATLGAAAPARGPAFVYHVHTENACAMFANAKDANEYARGRNASVTIVRIRPW